MVILTQIFESWTVTIIGSSLSGQEIKFYGELLKIPVG